jgi:iron-sulfur cluster assembly accessory protein
LIAITERAAAAIKGMRESLNIGPSMHLRMDVVGGAKSGFAYDLFFDDADSEDELIEQYGITLLVRPDSAEYLDGSTIDWVESDNGAGFFIANPNEPEK